MCFIVYALSMAYDLHVTVRAKVDIALKLGLWVKAWLGLDLVLMLKLFSFSFIAANHRVTSTYIAAYHILMHISSRTILASSWLHGSQIGNAALE